MAVRDKIIAVLQDAPDRTLERADIRTLLEVRFDYRNPNAVAQALLRMMRDGTVTRPGKGTYRLQRQ